MCMLILLRAVAVLLVKVKVVVEQMLVRAQVLVIFDYFY